MKISSAGLSIIKEFEGFRAEAYKPIPSDPWTIGYGFTKGVKQGDTITRAEAEIRLRRELVEYERGVERATKGHATQPQFDALVSFAERYGIPFAETQAGKGTVVSSHPLTVGARVVLNAVDAAAAGLVDGAMAKLRNGVGTAALPVLIDERVAVGCVWIETGYGASAPLAASARVEVVRA